MFWPSKNHENWWNTVYNFHHCFELLVYKWLSGFSSQKYTLDYTILHLQVLSLVDLVYVWQLCANSIPPCTSYLVCDSSLNPSFFKIGPNFQIYNFCNRSSLLVMQIEQHNYKAYGYDWMGWKKSLCLEGIDKWFRMRETTLWCNWHVFLYSEMT